MFCKNCGKEIDDNAFVCVHCGVTVTSEKEVPSTKYSPWAIVGMIVSLASLLISFFGVVPLIGIIFSCIGMKQTAYANVKGRGMAITGLVIGIIGVVYTILVFTVLAELLATLY